MNRAQKVEAVEALHKVFQENETVIITHYNGLTVAQITDLRRRLREQGGSLKVAKNRLAKRALKGTRFESIADLLTGPTAIATSKDPIAAAKVTFNYAKDNEKFVIVGGAMGETVLDAKGVEALAKLPSLDEMRAKLLALFVTPATRIARITREPAGQLARVVRAYADKG